jgi:hypothetical protein
MARIIDCLDSLLSRLVRREAGPLEVVPLPIKLGFGEVVLGLPEPVAAAL